MAKTECAVWILTAEERAFVTSALRAFGNFCHDKRIAISATDGSILEIDSLLNQQAKAIDLANQLENAE